MSDSIDRGQEYVELEDHLVVCGWNDTGVQLVQDLLASGGPEPIVVLAPEQVELPSELSETAGVRRICGVPRDVDALRRASASEARVVVVLAEYGPDVSAQDADSLSILTAYGVEQLNREVHTIVELRNDDNLPQAEMAQIDEVIVASRYAGVMLSQALQGVGLSGVFASVFATGRGVTFVEASLPDELDGTRFRDAISRMMSSELGVLVGVRRNRRRLMPPARDLELAAGDQLILLRRVDSSRR